jgi:hypothetical protein
MPGHGTGTLGILAGKKVSIPGFGFNDNIGLSDGFEIVPVRVARSVVLFRNESFARALDYIISLYDNVDTRVPIVTMSMGGLASRDWADAVNRAYEKGIFIVTAAGNNFGRATPSTLVYPSRFKRVVAACGVTYDYSPYFKPFGSPLRIMQGNFGPRKAMTTAVAAFTPNMPWAKMGCGDVVSLAGAGTSSATPQVASCAALYYLKYFNEIQNLPEGWMRVEAVRHALFQKAKPEIIGGEIETLHFGRGVIDAVAMLTVAPDGDILRKEDPDILRFPLIKLLTGINVRETLNSELNDPQLREMFELEILQLVGRSAGLQEILQREERSIDDLTAEEERAFALIILDMPEASHTLKDIIRQSLG